MIKIKVLRDNKAGRRIIGSKQPVSQLEIESSPYIVYCFNDNDHQITKLIFDLKEARADFNVEYEHDLYQYRYPVYNEIPKPFRDGKILMDTATYMKLVKEGFSISKYLEEEPMKLHYDPMAEYEEKAWAERESDMVLEKPAKIFSEVIGDVLDLKEEERKRVQQTVLDVETAFKKIFNF